MLLCYTIYRLSFTFVFNYVAGDQNGKATAQLREAAAWQRRLALINKEEESQNQSAWAVGSSAAAKSAPSLQCTKKNFHLVKSDIVCGVNTHRW